MTDNSFVALDLASRGWPVFPCELKIGDDVVALEDVPEGAKVKKVPVGELVENGFKEATTNAKKIALWWRVRPDALVGIALPKGTMVVDVDEVEKFARAGLDLPKDAPVAPTLSGGFHVYLRTDGRPVRQTVKSIPGTDTRVGGRGYVIAWSPQAIPSLAAIPDAPEWVYDVSEGVTDGERPRAALAVVRRGRRDVEVATIKVGQRDNELARVAGSLRKAGLGPDAIYAAFSAMMANGQIESPREDPITDKDLRRIAGSIGTRQSDAVDRGHRETPAYDKATDLMRRKLRELEYPVDEIFPEGLGIVAGAPKVGKSWLTLQTAVAIASGTKLLGRGVDKPRPVLYYGLEDGERRLQKRIGLVTRSMWPNADEEEKISLLELLALRYDAPVIGSGLEEDVESFIEEQGGDAVVFIDVLARIRPQSRGRGSAYDEDYSVLSPLQEVAKAFPGAAIVVVTHDRKMGSDDPLTTVQGTRGIVGSVDWLWIVKRPRLETIGSIFVTGRDIERDSQVSADFNGVWTLVARRAPAGLTPAATAVWDALDRHAPADVNEVTDEVYGDVTQDPHRSNHYNAVFKIISGLEKKSYAKRVTDKPPYQYIAISEEQVVAGQAGGMVPAIRRVPSVFRAAADVVRARESAGAGGPGQTANGANDANELGSGIADIAPSSWHSRPGAPARPRAPAYTRTRSDDNIDDDGLEDVTDLLEIKA